jgi:hypothetical protein
MAMYFLHLYENGTMKLELVLRTEGWGMRENNGGDESNQCTL